MSEVETARLLLRRWQDDDLERLVALYAVAPASTDEGQAAQHALAAEPDPLQHPLLGLVLDVGPVERLAGGRVGVEPAERVQVGFGDRRSRTGSSDMAGSFPISAPRLPAGCGRAGARCHGSAPPTTLSSPFSQPTGMGSDSSPTNCRA
jgi:hypothetical protein